MNRIITFLTIALFIIPTYLLASQSQNLESVLLEAASAGNTDMVRSFLDKGANIESKNEVGATPLIFASAKGQKEVVALLLDRGANVNAKTSTGITPLMAAASGGYADIVKLLLAKGADVYAKDQQGLTALSMAVASGDSQVTDLLKSAQKSSAPEKPRVASPGTSYSQQRSAGPSDSSSADTEPSSPTPDVSQSSDQSSAGQPGGLLNNPLIGQVLNRVLGGQQSDPGNVAAIQNVNPGAPNQPQAQGANAQGNAPAGNAQGNAPAGNAQNQGTAQANNPNGVVTPFTDTNGFVGTKTFNPSTGVTETKATGKNNSGQVTTFDQFQDKSGKVTSRTDTIVTGSTPDGGQKLITLTTDANGKQNRTDTTVSANGVSVSRSGDGSGSMSSMSETTPDGRTVTHNYTGDCRDPNGAGCQQVSHQTADAKTGKTTTINYNPDGSAVKKAIDPTTGKMTTTNYDKNGNPIGTPQISDIPKNAQQNAATLKAGANTLKANTKPQGLTATKDNVKADVLKRIQANQNRRSLAGAKTQNLVGQNKLPGNNPLANKLQGLASNKQQIQADVLNQIQNKTGPKGVKENFKADASKQIGSKFGAIPKIQSPSEFSQGNKHQPQNNLTTNLNARSKSLNWNSSAGSHQTLTQSNSFKERVIPQTQSSFKGKTNSQNFNTQASGQVHKRNGH